MRSRFISGAVLVGVMASMSGGCAGDDPSPEQEALTFETPAALYGWLAGTASDLGLPDVRVARDAAGEITSVTMPKASRDALMRSLNGDAGYFVLAGHRIDSFAPNAPSHTAPAADGVAEVQSALSDSSSNCAGNVCVYGSSYNTHITLFGVGYHDVGSDTSVSPSSAIFTQYTAFSKTTCSTVCNRGCVCTTTNYCNAGDALVDAHISGRSVVPATCYHSYGSVGVGATFFKTINGTPTAVGTVFASNTIVPGAEAELTAFGSGLIWGDYPEASINGVCGTHSAVSNGSSVYAPGTSAGSTSGCF